MPERSRLGSVARRLAATQRLVVVEDEHDIADFLRAYFRASGYDLVHVDPASVEEALEAIAGQQPDCVLLDLQLRGFSGIEVYRRMRSEDAYAFTPVIIVSAAPSARSVVSGALDGAAAKPFNADALAGEVAMRITRAAELKERAGALDGGLLDHAYVEARLADEIAISGPERPAAFALLRLLSQAALDSAVGLEGRRYAVAHLVARARQLLPPGAVLGRTDTEDLSLLLPGLDATEAQAAVASVLADIGPAIGLPGGADAPVRLAVGIASYPDHAADPDAMYMAADAALAEAIERGGAVVTAR